MLKVHAKYYNGAVELVGEEDIPFDVYCLKLAQESLRILKIIEESGIDTHSDSYKTIRHKIFDLCGDLQRLPSNVSDE